MLVKGGPGLLYQHSVYLNVLRFALSGKLIWIHYSDVIMGEMASQSTSLTIVYSIVNSGADQRTHQSSASLVFVRGIHRWPVNSPHKWPVTRKMSPFDDVIMYFKNWSSEIWSGRNCKTFWKWCTHPLGLKYSVWSSAGEIIRFNSFPNVLESFFPDH